MLNFFFKCELQVCLHGLNLLMPIMNAELLRFPLLCHHYYKLITFACEICPQKIVTIPADMLSNLFASLQLGMNSFGTDVASLCFEFIQVRSSLKPIFGKKMQLKCNAIYFDIRTHSGFIVAYGQD